MFTVSGDGHDDSLQQLVILCDVQQMKAEEIAVVESPQNGHGEEQLQTEAIISKRILSISD